MNKIFTGIISALLLAGTVGVYIPNVSATILEQPETCTGNSALGQDETSSAEQGPSQDQASGSDGQSIGPEFNALTGNSLNLNNQQNGDCLSPLTALGEQNPSGLAATNEEPEGLAAVQNSAE